MLRNDVPTTSDEAITQFPVPVAPLAEQRRIVGKLELLLGKVSSSQQRLSRVPGLLKRFRQSVLAAACSGKLTADWREENHQNDSPSEIICRVQTDRMNSYHLECTTAEKEGRRKPRKPSNLTVQVLDDQSTLDIPDGWIWLSFEDIASSRPHAMSSGPFGSALGSKDYQANGVPVIRVQNIQMGNFVADNFVFVSEDKAKELSRSSACPGDIVVVAVGVTAGNAAVVTDTIPRGVLSQNCNKMTIDTSLVVADFVVMVLQLDLARDQLRDKTTDTARPFLSLTNLKETRLPVPPLSEQQEIVRRVEKLFAFADQIEARLRQAQAHVDRLTQSLLAKAFRGELVPTEASLAEQEHRDYETASALLKRLNVGRPS